MSAPITQTLQGVWEMHSFYSATQGTATLERVNITAVPGSTDLLGVVHVPEGKTWGALPSRELRVEFSSEGAPTTGVLYERAAQAPNWRALCDFAFRPAGEGGVALSASPACTWALHVGANASSIREWTLSAAAPYVLQHGVRRPEAVPPLTLGQRIGQLWMLPVLLLSQGVIKYFFNRYRNGGAGGSRGGSGRKARMVSAADAVAERERAAKRAALAGAAGGAGADSSAEGSADAADKQGPTQLAPTDAAAKKAL